MNKKGSCGRFKNGSLANLRAAARFAVSVVI